jgi:hypothetical protein
MQKVERRILLVMHSIVFMGLRYVISLYLDDSVRGFFFGFGWCGLFVFVTGIVKR